LRQYTVWIYRVKDDSETLVWAGEQATREAKLDDGGNNWITIHCFDWLELLNTRLTVYEEVYEWQNVGFIIKDLITKTQADGSYGDLGITFAADIETAVDISRDLTLHNDNIMEAIIGLSDTSPGFDLVMNHQKVLRIADVIGEDKTNDVVLEYGVNIASCRIVEDFTKPTNRAVILGNAIGEETMQRVEVDDTTSQGIYKLREQKYSDMDEVDLAMFTDRGNALLRKYKDPLMKVDVQLTGSSRPNISEFDCGDSVKLIIVSGPYAINADYRVFEWEVSYDDDNAERLSITLGNFTYV
jgi:hypothetical protein